MRDGSGPRGAVVRRFSGRGWARGCAYFALGLVGAGAPDVLGTKACAQAAHSDNPPLPAQTYLTGNWGGYRSYFADNGVNITLPYINDFLANAAGGIKTGAAAIGAFQPQIDIDLQKLGGWQGGHIHVHGVVTYGPLFSELYLGNILAVSNLEAGSVARLYALWFEQNALDETWSIRTGLMLADSQFLQSPTAANFINNGISWPTFLAANLPSSGPAYPLPAPGFRLRVKPRADIALQAAVFSGDPSGGDGTNQPHPLPTGTVFSFSGGAFLIAEASYLHNQGKNALGLPGAYRIGGWYHTSPHFGDQLFATDGLSLANPLSTGIPFQHTGDYGVYGMLDQMFYRVPGTDDQGVSGFLRAGGVPNDRNLISFYADAGLVYKGPLSGRPDDKIGIATAYARVGEHARQLDADIGRFGDFYYPIRSGEAMIEMMYLAQLTPSFTLQPDLQYIIRPDGGVLNRDDSLRPNAWVLGLRSTLNF